MDQYPEGTTRRHLEKQNHVAMATLISRLVSAGLAGLALLSSSGVGSGHLLNEICISPLPCLPV